MHTAHTPPHASLGRFCGTTQSRPWARKGTQYIMWQQVYDPLNSSALSALVAAVPIIFFLLGLTVLKLSGIKSAVISLVIALVIGCAIFGMPITAGAGSILYGFLSGMWPIGWIVLMAVWLYRIAVRSGKFAIVRSSVSSISADQRIQVLLIALCFAGFIEGAAGFGIPIAISVALLVALGFNPLKAAMLSLVANATVGAYGAVGIPVTTGAAIGNVDLGHLSNHMVWVLQIFAALVPVLVVAIQDGLRGIREVGLVALATGIVISGLQSIMLWVLQDPELIGIVPPLVGLVFLAVVMRFWQPKHIYREPTAPTLEELSAQDEPTYSLREVASAWSPFIFLSITILLWSTVLRPVFDHNGALGFANLSFHVPGIHHQIGDGEGLAIHAVFNWNILGAAGTAILVAALLSAFTSKITVRETLQELNGAWQQLKKPIYMICLVMSVANLMNYAGMTSSIALAVATAGALFPLFSPIIGWVGVFVTGSVTNNNVLFAGLQASTAHQIGVDPAMLVAANTSGGVMGKIVSPQSIAVAVAAVNEAGQESKVTSITIKYSLFLLVLLCIWTYLLTLIGH